MAGQPNCGTSLWFQLASAQGRGREAALNGGVPKDARSSPRMRTSYLYEDIKLYQAYVNTTFDSVTTGEERR